MCMLTRIGFSYNEITFNKFGWFKRPTLFDQEELTLVRLADMVITEVSN